MSANRILLFNNTSTVDSGSAGVTDPSEVVDQQIAFFDADDYSTGTLNLTGANATDRMQIVQGDDNDPIVTQIIEKSKIKDAIRKDFQAYANQVTHVGYQGSGSNDIDAQAGEFTVKLVRLELGYEQFPRASASYTASSTDTPVDIATNLVKDLNALDGSKSFVRTEVLTDQASSQLVDDNTPTAASVTLDVTEGSKQVTATVTNGQAVNAVAGDFLRIGSATDLGFGVYEIESLDAASGTEQVINLVIPYGQVTATGVAAGKLDAIPDASDAGGIEITAKDIDEVEDFVDSTSSVSFFTALSEPGTTSVVIGTDPKTGSGNTLQMQELEKLAFANRGFYYRNYFPQTPESFVDSATNYDLVIIRYELNNDNAVVPGNKYQEIILAWDEGANVADQIATFLGV